MRILIATLFILFSYNMYGQMESINRLQKVSSLDSIISSLYGVISGEKGEPRNWDLMRYLFHADAKLIPTRLNGELYTARYLTVDDYIEMSGKWLVENGFHEIEINRKVDKFGPITQVFSTYESYRSKNDTKPFMRGINSIQLMNDGKRWWIVNIYWAQESETNPIPANYLPKY